MSTETISTALVERAVNTIESQVPGINFDSLCVLASETWFCREHKVKPTGVRLRILQDGIKTKCEKPKPVSVTDLHGTRMSSTGRRPLCISYGMGVDSTAILIYLARRYRETGDKIYRPDSVTFADTGNEKEETYQYEKVMQDYLKQSGFPSILTVRYSPGWTKNGRYHTLEQNCLVNSTLPSLAFGYKTCSIKWKQAPQNTHRRMLGCCQQAWAAGQQAIVAIGYDAGPRDARRADIQNDEEFEYWYPLIQLGWDRERCLEEIRAEGLPGFEHDKGGKWLKKGGVPVKSACFFCPSTQPEELVAFSKTEHGRDYLRAIIRMEQNAEPYLEGIEGLWRKGVKGNRGGKAKPGRMTDFIMQNDLLGGNSNPLPIINQFDFDCAERCAGCF